MFGTPANVMMPFTAAMPERIRSASSMPRALENTVAARPYFVAFASSTASSIVSTFATVTVGPNVSWVTAIESSGTSTSTVGLTQRSPTASAPPINARPPRASASSMWDLMIGSWLGIVIGPILDSSESSAETSRALATSLSTNGSYTSLCT